MPGTRNAEHPNLDSKTENRCKANRVLLPQRLGNGWPRIGCPQPPLVTL